MKRIIQIIAAMTVIVSMTGCVTPYLTDRVYDAADVFTIAVSFGGGAKARVGPVHTGLIADMGSYGLRCGEYGEMPDLFCTAEGEILIFPIKKQPDGKRVFSVEAVPGGKDGRGKRYNALGYVPFVTTGFVENKDLGFYQYKNPAYFTQIEFVAGFGLVLRLGVNPGELLDFILGWATVDIYGDDLGTE